MIKQSIKEFTMNWGEHKGLACTLPCSMYSVLLENKLIEDPFVGLNEKKYTDYSRTPTDFFSEFEVSEDAFRMKNLLLRMSRIDTAADIYLNGKHLAYTENMHRTYVFDVKGFIVKGVNQLRVSIKAPLPIIEQRQAEHFLNTDLNCTPGAPHLRKAFFMGGWDWAPTLHDMGIYGEVELIAFDKKIIDGIIVKQTHTDGEVKLELTLETLGEDDMSRAVATLVSPAGNVYYGGFIGGVSVINIKNPDLWWPNGLGAPNLYKLSVNLYSESVVEDSREMRIGLRTLTVSRDKDEIGEEFALTVNGVKFFSMGANYVPEDSLIARGNPERTRKLLRDVRRANFNTLRVWGGAYYPQDWFFDLCDEYGLVVWQDFMVACCNILMTDKFREEFAAEFRDNFRRIAHHACLGVVSGNNEMEQFLAEEPTYWHLDECREDYLALYEGLLPELAKKYIPDTFYWPASPSSGGSFDNPNDMTRGDCHYWAMWGAGVPFEECREKLPRYCSEYGYEALPSIKTVKSYAEGDDLNMYSPVMELHQKKPGGTVMITSYASRNYRYPNSLEELIYTSQLMQMEANACLVEHMRANRGACMGSIYWQLNDCWPVASWSSIDYFGRWKALHYGAKRMYAPVLITAINEGARVKFSLCNERLSAFDGCFSYAIMDSSNNPVFKDSFNISAEPMSGGVIHSCDFGDILRSHEDEYYLVYSVQGSGYSSKGTLLFTKPKAFRFKKPDITASVSGSGRSYVLTVRSDVYAKSVELDFDGCDAVFEDNYFDITDKNPVRISFTTDEVTNADTLNAALRIRSVYDIGR